MATSTSGGVGVASDTAPPQTVAEDKGKLAPVAARILMKILYGARNARPDILKAVTHLACFFTKWSTLCDRRLHRLVCYIHSTYKYRLLGWIGDQPSARQPYLFAEADADFARCPATQRSTSGLHLGVRGPNSCFPMSWVSKLQNCVSHSKPKAEMVSIDHAPRHCGLACLLLWRVLLPRKPALTSHEGNQAMIKVGKSGRSPIMRYLGRNYGVSAAWLHEIFKGADLRLAYEVSMRVCAGIYTKASTRKS
jgi:hypothetical protein